MSDKTFERIKECNTFLFMVADKTMEKMNKEKLNQLINEELENTDVELREGLYDVYYSPNDNLVYLVASRMAFEGDDEEAYDVAQVEEQEVINCHV